MLRVQGALVLATLGMEGCWLFGAVALASLLAGLDGPALSFLGVLLLVSAAYGVAWVLERTDLPLPTLQALGAALGVMVVTTQAQVHTLGLGGLAPWNPVWFVPWFGGELAGRQFGTAILAVGAGLLLWWRGVRLAQREPAFEPVLRSLRIGFGVVSVEALLEAFRTPAEPAAWAALPFFTLGLLALSLAHFEEIGLEAWVGSARRWVWLPPLVLGGIALVGVNIGLGVYAWAWDLVLAGLSLVDRVIGVAVYGVLLLVGLLAELVITLLRMLLALMGAPTDPLTLEPFELVRNELRQEPEAEGGWLRGVVFLVIGVVMALVVGSIVLWLARALDRRRGREREHEDEVRESLWTEGALAEEMQDLLRRLAGRFRRRPTAPFLTGPGSDPRSILLYLYHALLAWAAQRGVPRPPWQTPAEFQGSLAGAFPGGEPQVARLTQGFMAARYSPVPPSPEAAERARADWEALRHPGQVPELGREDTELPHSLSARDGETDR
ncbi:MAG: DUF4129 domain-containing protein [Chloroflexi bacterium]|nr:DUF4129 domain-containing protein [Chloroflexota bacterium]